jgi:hypothetical protein
VRRGLHAKPELRGCLKRCRHCRIFFLTHPRNAGRADLHCPFGCRDVHRRRQSVQRTAAYYRDEKGREKKAAHNRNRYLIARSGTAPKRNAAEPRQEIAPILKHVRMVVSLIEGRTVSWVEIGRVLASNWRQRPIGRRREVLYVLWRLNKDPP